MGVGPPAWFCQGDAKLAKWAANLHHGVLDPPQANNVHDPNDSRYHETGFPSLQWEDEALDTRPMPMHERPLQARIDYEMAIIAEHHVRIALAIEKFWGHRDCVEYIQTLILSGGDNQGKHRVGFKADVLSALINLVALHQEEFPA